MIPRAILALAVAAALPQPGRAQTPEQLVDSATVLQEAGRWAESHALLSQRLVQCGPAPEARPCRVALGRALGYAYQRAGLIERAIAQYREVLREAPADGTSLTNLALALRSLGRGPEVETLARTAISQDPDNAGFYWLLLGDVYEERGDWAQAAAAYHGAMAAAPADETPRGRLVEVYRHLPHDSIATLFAVVSRDSAWASRFPEAAAQAYELVVDSVGRRNTSLSQRACLNWITVLADARVLTVARLEVVDQQWLGPQLDQLKRFIRDPAQVPPRQGLWGSFQGTEVVGRAALSLGRQRLAADDSKGADAYWQAGLRAGDYSTPVSLDLALELGALYETHPDLDPNHSTFSMIEGRLLSGKAEAYYRADLEAIQRFHTILGLIYVQRRVWGPTDVPWKNAVYQLDHALSTARRRDAGAGTYQPLPELREQLARAYEATGRRDTARATYVAAAIAYLDIDQLGPASQMIGRGTSIGGSAADPRLAALERIVQARADVSTATGARPTAEKCGTTARQATGSAAEARLDAAFVKRQHFKVLADCLLAGPADVRPEDAALVLTAAVRDSVPLVGVGDLVRIERSQKVINRTLRLAPDKGRAFEELKPYRPNSPALQLQLPAQSRPTYIHIGSDALIGATAIERVGADSAVQTIRVSQGVVTVAASGASAADQSRIESKLQGVGTRTAFVFGRDSGRTRPPYPGYESARQQASELRKRAVSAGVTDADLAIGDFAFREAATLAAQGQGERAVALLQSAAETYAEEAGRAGGTNPKTVTAALEALVADYARALESRRIDAVVRIVRDIDAKGLDAFLQRAEGLRAHLQLTDITPAGPTEATGTIVGTFRYREHGEPRERGVKQRASFQRKGDTWWLVSVR